ncbi:MAG: helix-turn-helix domain-containing protein [Planctomycetes bacterium]|nr:helix-turn-helix domain-containing protein [Planctomycetota bacterium]
MPEAEIKAYYPPAVAAAPGAQVHRLGVREPMPAGLVDRPRGSDDVLVMVFHGETAIDGGPVQAGPFARVWPPRTPHRYGHPGRPWSHSWIHVRGAGFATDVARAGVPLDRAVAGFQPEPFEHLLRLIHAECAGRPRPDLAIVLDLLRILVRMLRRDEVEGPDGAIPPALSRLCQELHGRPGAHWDIPRMARLCGWSESRFSHRFRAALGVPPLEYLIQLRLRRARELLNEPGKRVHAVAAEVGYHDLPHFCRIFKQRFGASPRQLGS